MTSAQSSDAITKSLTPGAAAVLLTEYMPDGAQIINTAVTGTAYLGTSSSVQASNGVPLPAGSSVQWVNPGQLWAVAGADATGPIPLTVTSAIETWAPSPSALALATAQQMITLGIPGAIALATAQQMITQGIPAATALATVQQMTAQGIPAAIAAATAQQLLATGVPNIFQSTAIVNADPINGGASKSYNVSDYTSIDVFIFGQANQDIVCSYLFNNSGIGADIACARNPGPVGTHGLWVGQIPVIDTLFRLTNAVGANQVAVTILGTNRPIAAGHPVVNGYSSSGFEATLPAAVPLVAGTSYQMSNVRGGLFQGPGFAHIGVTGLVAKGDWRITTPLPDGSTITTNLGTTAEAVSDGTDQMVMKMIALPANEFTVAFLCRTAAPAGANALLRAVPAY